MDKITLDECLEILKAQRNIKKERRFPLDDDVLDKCISLIQNQISWENSDAYRRGNQ